MANNQMMEAFLAKHGSKKVGQIHDRNLRECPLAPKPVPVTKPVTKAATKPVTPRVVTNAVTSIKHCPTCSCARVYTSNADRQKAYRQRKRANGKPAVEEE